MFDPRAEKESRDFSLMNPANMRELFKIGETTSCPMKKCEDFEKTPLNEERKAKAVDLSKFNLFADKYQINTTTAYALYQYAKYLSHEVYILPKLNTTEQDDAILRLKANVGARMVREFIFDEWSEDLIVMMVAGAITDTTLENIFTCKDTVKKLFPSKNSDQICSSPEFDPTTLVGLYNFVDLLLYEHEDLKQSLEDYTKYSFKDFEEDFSE